jgi:hypothetical protein
MGKKKRNRNRRNKQKKNKIKKSSLFSFNTEFYNKINIRMNITKLIREITINENISENITESINLIKEQQINLQQNSEIHPWAKWILN